MGQSINKIIVRLYEVNQVQTNEKIINRIQKNSVRLYLHSSLIYPLFPCSFALAAIHGSYHEFWNFF